MIASDKSTFLFRHLDLSEKYLELNNEGLCETPGHQCFIFVIIEIIGLKRLRQLIIKDKKNMFCFFII